MYEIWSWQSELVGMDEMKMSLHLLTRETPATTHESC